MVDWKQELEAAILWMDETDANPAKVTFPRNHVVLTAPSAKGLYNHIEDLETRIGRLKSALRIILFNTSTSAKTKLEMYENIELCKRAAMNTLKEDGGDWG